MRQILFKAKTKDTKEWAEGCLITDELSNAAFIGYAFGTDNGIPHDTDLVEVDPETLCQYTGLTDKNGKKVFEGDILEYDDEHWNVLYLEEDAMFGIESDGIFEHFGNVSSFLCEVIGNIYDEEEYYGNSIL